MAGKKSLYDEWSAMDDKRAAKNPVSLRMPVHVIARVNAIADLLPGRSRSDILNDLIKVGLQAFEESLPKPIYNGEPEEFMRGGDTFPTGPRMDYERSANEHYTNMEKELGNENPRTLFNLSAHQISPDTKITWND